MLLGAGAGGGDGDGDGDGGTPLFCAIIISFTILAYGDYFRFSSNNDICPKGFSVPTRKELAAETTLAEKNPINNKTIKDGNGTALAFSSFLKLPAAYNER
jgi:hypothetical protein